MTSPAPSSKKVSPADSGQWPEPAANLRVPVAETLAGFLAYPSTSVGMARDTEAEVFTEGGAMNDPTASLRDRTSVLGVALVQWADRSTARDKAAARRAGRTAVDAIDALLRDLFVLRGRLVQEIRQADDAARPRVA
jgi:hypothetical protein